MKHLARIFSLLILVSAAVFFAACDNGGEDGPSEKEKQIDLLVGTWNASAVTNSESGSHTDDYAGFTITISKSSSEAMTYVTANRPAGKLSPWNASGTFTFGDNIATELVRGDNVEMTYTLSGSNLVLTLPDYSGEGYVVPGRTESVEGDWVFTMAK